MNKCNVMVFAAGLGTRLRPHTNLHPKPVLPLNQIPLGYYSLPYLEKIEIEKFIVNTFHLPEQVHQLYSKLNSSIVFSDEKDFIKGSGGGLKVAEDKFNKNFPILTMNADEIFFTEEIEFLNNALEAHTTNKNYATLVVTEHPEAGKKFGDIWCDNHKVIHIGKDKPNETAKPWHFIGLQFLSNEILDLIPLNQETNIFYDVLIQHLLLKNIQIYPLKCEWYEVGNIADYQSAKSEINNKLKTNSIYQNHYKKLAGLPESDLSDLSE